MSPSDGKKKRSPSKKSLKNETAESDDARENEAPGEDRRAARRLNTRRRILDTTLDILVREGHEGFTIARLASELDYAVGALYRYFKGKDAILAALQRRILSRLEEDVSEVLDSLAEDASALEQVFATAIVYESLTWRRPTEHHVLALSLGDPRPLLKKEEVEGVLPALEAILLRLKVAIEAATDEGALHAGDSQERALVLWGSTYGIMALRKLERVRPEFADAAHAKHLHVALTLGWGASEDAWEAYEKADAVMRRVLT